MTSPATQILTDSLDARWDRALFYGDGLFETVAVFDGVAPLWQFHLARLKEGLSRLGINADVDAINTHVLEKAASSGEAVLRLVVARSGGGRGYDPRHAYDVIVQATDFPLPFYSRRNIEEGVMLHVCQHQLSHNPVLAGLKHLNRLDQVIAAAEWDRSAIAEGLMLDQAGNVIEGTVSNLFVFSNGVLQTPDISRCGVAGVMRAFILNRARGTGLDVAVRSLSLSEIYHAECVFVCNSVFGIWPVKTVGDVAVKSNDGLIAPFRVMLDEMGYGRLYA